MPVYTFKLRDGRGGVEDATGVALPNRDSALRYAHDVVYELMRSREIETRPWCLDVYETTDDGPICEIPFASVDPSLDHLAPTFRSMVETISERRRLLSDAIHSVKGTIQESRVPAASPISPAASAKPSSATIFDSSR
jgi:hypothetical protein